MTRPVRASAPGKLVLCGEYAVLEGAPALAVAINRRAVVSLTPSTHYQVSAPGFLQAPANLAIDERGAIDWQAIDTTTRSQLALFEGITSHLLAASTHQPFAAELDTRAFFLHGSKMGIGSSAALGISLTAALRSYLELPALSQRAMLDDVQARHRDMQRGRGSGIDLATSLYGGCIRFTATAAGANVQRVVLPDALHWLAVWTGAPASTGAFLAHVAQWKQDSPAQARRAIKALTASAQQAASALDDVDELLRAIAAFGSSLAAFGESAGLAVYSSAHRRIAEIAAGHGAVYKPSGAGGGDVGIAFARDKAALAGLRRALAAAGYECPDLQHTSDGLIIQD